MELDVRTIEFSSFKVLIFTGSSWTGDWFDLLESRRKSQRFVVPVPNAQDPGSNDADGHCRL